MFNHIGQKIINFFGETSNHSGDSKGYHKLWETVGQMHPLGACFPYQSYDEISQIFYNKSNAGFVIETLPLVGSSEDMQKKVNGLFQHVLPEESSLQVILWADPFYLVILQVTTHRHGYTRWLACSASLSLDLCLSCVKLYTDALLMYSQSLA